MTRLRSWVAWLLGRETRTLQAHLPYNPIVHADLDPPQRRMVLEILAEHAARRRVRPLLATLRIADVEVPTFTAGPMRILLARIEVLRR